MVTKTSITASYKGALVEYDGPQLAYFVSSRGYKMLAVAVDRDDMDYAMFAVEVSDVLFDRYLLGKTDLASLFRTAPKTRLYFLDFLMLRDNEIKLWKADLQDLGNDDFYPLPGLFSTTHTSNFSQIDEVGLETERFYIDGKWDARDFAQFSGKLADTYSLVRISGKLSSTTDLEDRDLLVSLIEDRRWQGGGSYGGFYASTKEKTRRDYPLNVIGIEYHSPGYIDMRGHADTLNEVIASILVYLDNRQKFDEEYRGLHKLLQREGLLSADKSQAFSSEETRSYAVRRCISLADNLGLPNTEKLSAMCASAPVFVKVILSFFRRIKALSLFYVEGRVRSDEPPISIRFGSDQ
ncbi:MULTISPECIES: hypothetical protein [Rhizobium]|uniref:hypothetical protein n=1 Tax=Rhizobium TaxID=379 RepID=UPI001A8E9556|nr:MULTISPECIES: hypothetical protein [Rhizobium]MBN9981855.1 hypothetical protein [Rhizobium laguerreae]MBY5660690.1 hypothetical protein [Rhizobium leguminosarum]MBY5674725.1 hypothetical protein [Rhizobium leguminosarum]